MTTTIPNTIFNLTPSQKLQLVEELWDNLATTPNDIPLYEWQKIELDRRKALFLSNPSSALSWEEVQQKVRNRYAD